MEKVLIELLSSEISEKAKLEFAQLELQKGSDPNYVDPDSGISAMHLASGEGSQILRLMLLYGGDPNIMSVEKLTPLHVAASWGDKTSVSLLLQSGADISLQDQDGMLAIDLALQFGHEDCVHLLEHQHKKIAHLQEAAFEEYLSLTYKKSENSSSAQKSLLPSSSAHHFHSPTVQSTRSPPSCHCTRESSPSSHNKHFPVKSVYTPSAQEHSPHMYIPVCSPCHNTSKILPRQSPICNQVRRSHSITKALYDYLEGGRQVVFDVTSPNTPYIRMKECESEVPFSSSTHITTCSSNRCEPTASGSPYRDSAQPELCCSGHTSPLFRSGSPLVNMSSKGSSPKVLAACGETCPRSTRTIPSADMYASSCTTFQNRRISSRELNEKTNLSHIDSELSDPQILFRHSSNGHHHSPTFNRKVIQEPLDIAHSSPHSIMHKKQQRTSSQTDTGLGSSQLTEFTDDVSHDVPINLQVGRRLDQSANCLPNEQGVETVSKKSKDRNGTSSVETKPSYFPPLHPFSPAVDSERRVAEFVLSTTELFGQCCLREEEGKSSAQPDVSQVKEVSTSVVNISNSSADSFETCNESINDCARHVQTEINQHAQPSNHYEVIFTHVKPSIKFDTSRESHTLKDSQRDCENMNASRWKPPKSFMMHMDDLMTSDDSFVNNDKRNNLNLNSLDPIKNIKSDGDFLTSNRGREKSVRSPRIYRMKRKKVQGNSVKYGTEIPKNLTEKTANANQMTDKPTKESSFLVPNAVLEMPAISKEKGVEKNIDVKKSPKNKSRLSTESLFSTVSVREHIHRDPFRGIVLLERHLPSECGSSISRRSIDSVSSLNSLDSKKTIIYDWKDFQDGKSSTLKQGESPSQERLSECTPESCDDCSGHEESRGSSTIPSHLESLSNQEVAQALQRMGESVGPVVAATRQAYLKKLASLEPNPGMLRLTREVPDYPPELYQALKGRFDNGGLEDLEMTLMKSFSSGQHWREGKAKSSFTYLLLDPRVTDNLPFRARTLGETEVLETFIGSIFYIGKGKSSRPYCHLYEAVSKMKKPHLKKSAKVQRILDIWESGLGVVFLQCFQSCIPVEAYTREGCMLEAIGMHRVTNVKKGDFYGSASTWSGQQRRRFGVYLLQKAKRIFLEEGERQISVPDLQQNAT